MERRITILRLILIFSLLIILAKLIQLQVFQGRLNRLLAETNRIQRTIIDAPRGIIFDRHGEILAGNEPQYLLNGEEVEREEALKLQAEDKDIDLKINFRRKYYFGKIFAHVIGFLGEITEDELKKEKLSLKGYVPGDLIGRMGIEAEYEAILRGLKGTEAVEVDTRGQVVRRISQISPIPGKGLTLAVDRRLQEIASKTMKSKTGAVVATKPQTGEILLIYSSPSFDPEVFIDEEKKDKVIELIGNEKERPLFNRVISGVYPPGSTFKIVTSIAALEEGKITAETVINDPGEIVVNNYKFANWYFTQYGKTEGEVNLTRAIARSTDTFFYKVGERLGADSLIDWAKRFGLDKKFGLDLPGETEGFIATPEWKKKVRGEDWFLGNTYHLAIGQGDISLTPLGVNLMTAVVANGGKLCKPRMLRLGAENTPYKEECLELEIKEKSLNTVKKGMIDACTKGGTGWPFFEFRPQVACKTGTAETGDGKTSHAWFTVFAPADNPQIVLTVLVEKGGEGSSVAGPIAKEILKEYFQEQF